MTGRGFHLRLCGGQRYYTILLRDNPASNEAGGACGRLNNGSFRLGGFASAVLVVALAIVADSGPW